MMQNLFAKHLGLEEQQVRVVTKDVGGSFGIKVHTYADEMATVALSKLLQRPVKFVADRLESFVTDIHARDHRVKAQDRREDATARSPPGRSTISPASGRIRSIRAPPASRPTRS